MFFAVRILCALLSLAAYGLAPGRVRADTPPRLRVDQKAPSAAAEPVRFRFTRDALEIVARGQDPAKPAQLLGRLRLGGLAVAWVRNDRVLYIALAPSDIVGVDVSDPRHPIEVLRLREETASQLMLVQGRLIAYQRDGSSRLYDARWPPRLVRLDPARPPGPRKASFPNLGLLQAEEPPDRPPIRRALLGLTLFPSLGATSFAAFRVEIGTDYTAASGLWSGGRLALISSLANDWLPSLALSGLLGGSGGHVGAGLIAGVTVGFVFDEEGDHGLGRAHRATLSGAALLGLALRFGPSRQPRVRLDIEWSVGPAGVALIPMAFLTVNLFTRPRMAMTIQGQDVSGGLQFGYQYRY